MVYINLHQNIEALLVIMLFQPAIQEIFSALLNFPKLSR
jgi:hypothetical protein